MESSGHRISPWMDHPQLPALTSLDANLDVDACVVGAGIAGLSVAYQLARRGLSVVVLEDGENIASGETGRTTAHLTWAIDDRFYAIERAHGLDAVRTCAESSRAAIDEIERAVRDEDIACDFQRLDGYLFLGEGDDIGMLGMELATLQRAGIHDVLLVEKPEGLTFDPGPSLLFPNQGQFHPVRYLAGLARAATTRGARIFGSSHVTAVHDGAPARVDVRGGFRVTAKHVVVATCSPINDKVVMTAKQAAWRTYAIGARIPRQLRRALLWDTSQPYHYARTQSGASVSDDDLLIVGGEDHRTGQADDAEARWDRITAWTRERFPMMKDVVYRWSGQVMEPSDGVAFIGLNPGDEHVYIVTGDSGQGMTHATIAGLLLADLITGKPNAWAELYDPSRLPLHSLGEQASNTVDSVLAFRGWFTPGDIEDVTQLAAGHGGILRRGLGKVACYRDDAGVLHERSAVCPHLGAIVTWNDAEKTWDCPAHGSRYDAVGKVMNGPANQDLEQAG